MSVEAVSESVERLLKQIFKGDDSDWPGENAASSDAFLDAINFHGLTPVFWYWINQYEFCKNWPSSLLSSIKNIAIQEMASDLLCKVELKKNLQLMSDVGIHPVLIKGTPLSHTLYPTSGLRPRCDTDLLIAEKDIDQTAELMRQLGYESLYDAKVELFSSQMTFVRRDKLKAGHAYDIHWRINNRDRSFSDELNYSRLFSSGMKIPQLSPHAITMGHVDSLLLACFHRAGHFSHSGERLIWLYDIHLLMNALDENEFDLFFQNAQQLSILTICSDAILTAQDWFNTSLTESRLKRLKTLPESEASTVYLETGRQAGIKNHALLELKGLSSLRDKFRYLIQKMFPPVNYMLWRYNTNRKYLLPFLYLYRLIYGTYIFVRR